MKTSKIKSLLAIMAIMVSFPLTSFAQVRVSGKVVDKDGLALIGATVIVDGTKNGVLTDVNGAYQISVPADAVLRVEYLGYQTQKIKVGDKKVIDFTLLDDTQMLDETVVIGYGTAKKSDLTGSVTNVKMADIENAAVASIDQALQGRIAGADIMTSSGDPTSSTSIRIRGTRSITASNEPLIVVDGVIDAVQDMSEINSSDIESITILKDASSTAIYGARGSNGVIIITTNKGDKGSSEFKWVTAKANAGVAMLAKHLDIMDASEFATYINMFNHYAYGKYANTYFPSETSKFKDPFVLGKGTDWLREITRIAPYQDYNLSLGGNAGKKSNFYASLGYTDQEGIIKDSGFQRITGRFNISYQMFKWLKLSLQTSATYKKGRGNKANIGGTNYWNGAVYLNPLLDPTSTINDLYQQGSKYNSPVVCININQSITEEFANINTIIAEAKLAKNLVFKTQNTANIYQRHYFWYQPSTLPTKAENDGSNITRTEHDTRTITSDNTLTYKNDFKGGHHFDAVVGFLAYSRMYHDVSIAAKGVIADQLTWNSIASVASKDNYSPSSEILRQRKMSFIARANYDWNKRYFLTFTGRYDGSSNFAANNKWGFFPSGAFKWTVSNEPFMRRAKWINDLAVRVSAGRTGNDAIACYRSLYALNSSTNGYLFDGQQSTYYYPSRVASPDLTWEKTDLYNVAIDWSMFKDRLKITAEGYLSYTRDLLLSVQKANQTGYSSHYENIGRTSNKGVELSIESRNIVKKKFYWGTTFTISHNKQMVEDIGSEDFVKALTSGGNTDYMMYGYVKGYPLNALWGFQYGGVWHSQDEIDRNEVTRQYCVPTTSKSPGDARYIDQNHDGILDQNDLVYLGQADPMLYGGLQNTFNIGNFTASIYFSYSVGGMIYNWSELRMAGSYTTNQYRYMLNAWHPVVNPDSNLPRAGSVEHHVASTLQVHDASYLRLKSLNLSYKFDFTKKPKHFLRNIVIGVSADNLFLLSKYNGFDPDVSTESSGSTLRRVDMGAYPRSRTILANITIRY